MWVQSIAATNVSTVYDQTVREPLVLGHLFYIDEFAVAHAARERSSVNAIHLESSIKVDRFAE